MIRLILFTTTLITLFVTSTFSEIVKKINVEGNIRVSKSTIINFSDVKKNTNIELNNFNEILKNIYDTNFFEDVALSLDNGVLTIKVKEHPIIQSIIYCKISDISWSDNGFTLDL